MRKMALVEFRGNEVENDKRIPKILDFIKQNFKSILGFERSSLVLDDEIEFYIFKIHCSEKAILKTLNKIFQLMSRQGIDVVSFDEYLLDNYINQILHFTNSNNIYLSYGDNLMYPVLVRTIKKILKSKGYDIREVEVAIISEEKTRHTENLIRYFAPQAKYLTYVELGNSRLDNIINDIFINQGFSIRVCNDLNKCIKDVKLIINLSNRKIYQIESAIDKILVFNMYKTSNDIKASKNISVLNEILIDISSVIRSNANRKNNYKLAEMYILFKLDKLYVLKQNLSEEQFNQIYQFSKDYNIKVDSLEGINL